MNRKLKLLLLGFLNLALALTLSSCTNLFGSKNKITVTDMVGSRVSVKKIQVK